MITEEQIEALERRIAELEAKVEPLYQSTRCPHCDNAAQEEHDCFGDYNDTGKTCTCCQSCSEDCAQSV